MQHRLVNSVFVASQVITGFGRGSKSLGIPTANLEEDVVQGLALDDGIYYGFAQLVHPPNSPLNEKQKQLAKDVANGVKVKDNFVILDTCRHNPIYPMVCSLGWNPQFANKTRTLEAHLLNKFGYDFYGSLIRVAICGYIRPEKKFDSLQALIDGIHDDICFAKNALHEPEKNWIHVLSDRFFYI